MLKLSRTLPSSWSQVHGVCACNFSKSVSLPASQVNKPETGTDKSIATSEASNLKQVAPKPQTETEVSNTQQWKTPWHENEGRYFSGLRSFYSAESNRSLLSFMQTPVDFSPTAIKAWWKDKQKQKDIIMQSYIQQRNDILGNELAAAHFVLYRGGAIKFYGEDRWIKADEFGNYTLPNHYDGTKILEAIDCENMTLYYEGLINFKHLKQLKWLSLKGCDNIDDWCLDRISHIFRNTLVYLDLRNCANYTYRGLGALYKMKELKILYVDDMLLNNTFELTCLMLQEVNPYLDIRDSE